MNRRNWLVALFLMAGTYSFTSAAEPTAAQKEQFKKLADQLTGAKMTGQFTILGKEDKAPAKEQYDIVSATKVDDGDIWLIKARVRYGDKDVTVPVPVEIIWSGDTPVITLTNVTIPGLGSSFSSRIVIYDNLYAGTWRHGNVVGHLFGAISKEEKK